MLMPYLDQAGFISLPLSPNFHAGLELLWKTLEIQIICEC
jgi:hypothetical protein